MPACGRFLPAVNTGLLPVPTGRYGLNPSRRDRQQLNHREALRPGRVEASNRHRQSDTDRRKQRKGDAWQRLQNQGRIIRALSMAKIGVAATRRCEQPETPGADSGQAGTT